MPTRITSNSSTILDQCMSNCPMFIRGAGVLPPLANNDHCTIHLKILFKVDPAKCYQRQVWDFSAADTTGYVNFLQNFNFDTFFTGQYSVDQACELLTDAVLGAAKQFVPNRIVTIRPSDKSFYNSNLRHLKLKLDRLHKKAKTLNTPDIWARFRHDRNEYMREVKKAKYEYSKEMYNQVNTYDTSSKNFFSFAKKCFSHASDNAIPPIIAENGKIIVDDKDKATHFNKYFATASLIDESNSTIPSTSVSSVEILNDFSIGETEVSDQIKFLNVNKSYGPDGISPRFIKMSGQTLVKPLTKLFNMSLQNGIFPSKWKKANVLPLHKKSSKQYADNYRPVSLLCTLGKIFERIVFKHVYNHLHENKLLSIWQSGFIPGSSTVTQLIELCHKFSCALDECKDVRVVYLDISKAFDKVWHKGLLFKLKKFGIQGNMLQWFSSYLSDRSQRVLINGQFSDWIKILAGVPQGSVLGPLLFLIFINDITDVVMNCNIRLFADDTCLFINVKNHIEAATLINQDLKNIEEWAKQWLVTFSPSKTESMVISLKHHVENSFPRLVFYNTPIAQVKSHKHIGLWISHNLKWNNHIDSLVEKCSKHIGILKLLKFKLNRNALEKIFFAYIRPIMEYADVIWAGAPISVLSKLDHILVEAMRAVTGAPARSNISNLFQETGWTTLTVRREVHTLKMIFKISNNICPIYLNNILPPVITDYPTNTANLRHNIRSRAVLGNFPVARTRTKLHEHMFPAWGMRLWNALPNELKQLSSLKLFSSELYKLKNSERQSKLKRKLYCYGNRIVNITHACLRMKCSKLNSHLKQTLHVIEDEACACGHPHENTLHFFLHCPLYDNIRQNLQESVPNFRNIEFTPDILLFGSNDLSYEENLVIFNAVHDFISQSKRFILN